MRLNSNVGRQEMRHCSELGAVLVTQEDKQHCRIATAEPRAWARKTKNLAVALLAAADCARKDRESLHRCGSRTPSRPRWSGPSVLRRLANHRAPRATWRLPRFVAWRIMAASGHGSWRSGMASEPMVAARKAPVRRSQPSRFRSARMHAFSSMTPNPSIERTRSGLRPPRAAHVKR
jgi:hypothetical protein